MTQGKNNTQIDNNLSIGKHKPGELTAKQRAAGSTKGLIPVQLDSKTWVYCRELPTPEQLIELKIKYLKFIAL
jgi:hypothetical protein